MSISDEITRLTNAKAAIKQSIVNKGVRVSDSAKLDEYPALIDKIEGGGEGGGSGYENPDFYEIITKGGTDYSYLFYKRTINDTSFIESLDTSEVTNMSYIFSDCISLTSLDLSGWNTSNVTNMQRMFSGCTNLTIVDLSGNFDTSKNTDMSDFFYGCTLLQSINGIGTWNTSKLTTMYCAFQRCSNLTTLDLSSWDTSKVTNMSYTFSDDSKLITIIGELDASKLSNGFYPGSTSNAFKNCKALESVYIKNIYKDITIKNESKWSINLGDTIVKDECLVYIINELPDLINDKGLTATDKIVLTLPKTNTLTADQVQVARDKGWQVANTTY
jgi:surface protein